MLGGGRGASNNLVVDLAALPAEVLRYSSHSLTPYQVVTWYEIILIIYKCTVLRWASPQYYTADPRLLFIPSGNPFKYYIVALYL